MLVCVCGFSFVCITREFEMPKWLPCCQEAKIMKTIARMLPLKLQLFSFTKSRRFNELMHEMETPYKIPSRTTLSRSYSSSVQEYCKIHQEDNSCGPGRRHTTPPVLQKHVEIKVSYTSRTCHCLIPNFELGEFALDNMIVRGRE